MARSRRRRRGSTGSLAPVIGAVAIGLASLAIVGAFGWMKYRASGAVAVDAASLCPVTGPVSQAVMLLDITDPVSETTALDLKNQFERAVNAVPVGGAIDIYTLTEKEGRIERTFHGCNPGSGENADVWTSNPRLIQDRWERGFRRPLDEIAGRLASGKPAEASPIMAAIQRINLDVFAKMPAGAQKTLVIASDMIEHTPAFSVYRDGLSYETFEKSPAREKFRTSLDGISVRILAFQRTGLKAGPEEVAAFWNRWITANHGYFESFVRLEGIR